MLKINGKVWYAPLVNPGYICDLSEFARDATENECVLGAINCVWYHYPTLEEALEGLKKRSPEDYKREMYYRNNTTYIKGCYTAVQRSSSWCICEMEEERFGIHHWVYSLHK